MRIPQIDPQNTLLTASQVDQWNSFAASLDGNQLPWLLGFLSASTRFLQDQHAVPSSTETTSTAAAGEGWVTVLFASQTGNAAKVAKRLVAALSAAGLRAAAVSTADYKTSNLKNERNLVLISSTHGEGAVPDAAAEFHRFLFGKRAPKLQGTRFAVLALGDYTYKHFCKAGADFDRRLEELGAERMVHRVDCDVDYQADAEAWQANLLEALGKIAPTNQAGVAVATLAAQPVEEAGFDKQNPWKAAILDRINLNGRGSAKTTLHLELSLTGSGITYEPGDALGVLPRNPPSYVDELLSTARLAGDDRVTVDGLDLPLFEALTELFEITTITRPFVKAYVEGGRHPALASLLDKGNEDPFQAYVHGREIIDVLRSYPPGQLSPQGFVGMLRRLQPRLYSIASSLRAHEEEVHLLIGLTRYESHGRVRQGVCSSYLCERLGDDELVRVFPSPNPCFRLPRDSDARIVMIGPGTGVAPFRAFIEEREAAGCRGRNWLFFGDQHFATDFLYQLEWQRWHKSGVLSRLDLAFSRDQSDKTYVQHRMRENGRDLFAWLQDGAHVYVCGDAGKMAADVHESLLDIVSKHGGKTREGAVAYLDELLAQRRYQRDVY